MNDKANRTFVRLSPAIREDIRSLQTSGEPDLFKHLTEIFIRSSDEILAALARTTDLDTISRLAHTWRSSAAGIGAEILADLCKQLENEGDSWRATSLKSELEGEYSAVLAELKIDRKVG